MKCGTAQSTAKQMSSTPLQRWLSLARSAKYTHAAATKEVHREQVAVLQLNAKIEELETTLKDAKALREVTLERLDTKRRAASEAEDAFYNGVVRTKRAHLMVLSDRIPSYCPPDSPILRAQPFF